MKKFTALVLLVSFLLTGCQQAGAKVAEKPVFANTDYDVIVVGGEPEGVVAAVSAARNGMKTLLIEDDAALGGLMTLGQLNFIDMCHGRDGTLLTQGIFEEFYDAVGGTAFDIEKAKSVFLKMVTDEVNIDLKLNTSFLEPLLEDNVIVGVTVKEDGDTKQYRSARVIDATVDADVAIASGVPHTFAGEDIGEKDRQMGVTLVFTLQNVHWDKVVEYLENDGNAGTGANEKAAWGYTQEGFSYEPQDEMMRLRGFNAARQDDGKVLVNALIIFGVDVLDKESKAAAIERGRAELNHILPYVQENFIGFEDAELVGTAEQLYVRESFHIIGEYQLSIDDVLENRDQWDKIAIGNYPVDVQPTATQRYGTVIGSPDRYAIPFRSLVPLTIDNLLVVGRSASYKSLAAGSARVIPIGMAEGQAAGIATAYSVNNDLTYREMTLSKKAIQWVQKTLKAQGAYLEDITTHEDFMDHWAYEGVKVIRALGLLDGGYDNNYHLEDQMSKWRYQNMFNKAMVKAGVTLEYMQVGDNPTNGEIIGTVAKALNCPAESYQQQLTFLQNEGVIDEALLPYFADSEKNPQAAEVIMLVANLYLLLSADNPQAVQV